MTFDWLFDLITDTFEEGHCFGEASRTLSQHRSPIPFLEGIDFVSCMQYESSVIIGGFPLTITIVPMMLTIRPGSEFCPQAGVRASTKKGAYFAKVK